MPSKTPKEEELRCMKCGKKLEAIVEPDGSSSGYCPNCKKRTVANP